MRIFILRQSLQLLLYCA